MGYIFYENNTVLIYTCDKVSRSYVRQIFYQFHSHIIILISSVNNKYHTRSFHDMMPFCLTINIYNQHISKKNILNKIIPVKLLRKTHNQITYLAHCHLRTDIKVLLCHQADKNVFHLTFHHNLVQMIILIDLTLCHGICNIHSDTFQGICNWKCLCMCYQFSF